MFRLKTVAALLLSFTVLACDGGAKGIPVDYGSEVPVSDIQKAILAGVKGIDPSATERGAAVQYTTTQYLAGGQVVNLLGVTVLVVVEREEIPATANNPECVRLKFRESKTDYSGPRGEKTSTVEREFVEVFAKGALSSSFVAEAKGAPLALSAPAKAPSLHAFATSGTRVSFHKLLTSSSVGAPPLPVTEKANCREVPGCQMTYNKISFDQVAWKADGPEKIHFDFEVSPNVPQISGFNMSPLFPYYQGLVKSCVTLLVKVGDGYDKTLLMECQQVQDFLYRQNIQSDSSTSTTAHPF
jgi:hypothetical protein